MIELQGIYKRFGEKDVLRDVNARIADGEIFALIGPSGSGKSSLLRLINLLDAPSAGRVLVDGVDIHADRSRELEMRRRMGMVFQKPAVFNTTVYENIAYGLRFRGVPERAIRETIRDVLSVIGLEGYGKRRAKTLSGGEMQRVALARAMVTDPDILLMDEPTANLDPVSTETIERLVHRINREFGTTIVLATHDMVQGQRLAERIAVMMDGTFSQVGTPREIFALPKDRDVARFVGIENIIEGVVESNDGGIAVIDASGVRVEAVTPLQTGVKVCLCIRPEDITLGYARKAGTSARNVFPGKIVAIRPLGPLTRLVIDCGFELVSLITWKAAEELGVQEGTEIVVSFKASAVHVVQDRT